MRRHIALVGPSGCGKTTIAKKIVKNYPERYDRCRSITTKCLRISEINGVDYDKVSIAYFETMIQNNMFYEWNKPYGTDYYGTPKSHFDHISKTEEKNVILDIDIVGFKKMKIIFGDKIFGIFIDTKIPEIINFLNKRGDLTPEKRKIRMERALKEEYPFKYELDGIVKNYFGKDLDILANEIVNMSFK